MKDKKALTLTVVANMTSNYSEGLGNIASVQKVFKNRKVYTIRSRESLKNAIMVQSGMYNDLQTEVDGATQKLVNKELNASNCRALEGGYMSTKGTTNIRKSSFYLTDGISCESFVNETRFHNNLYLANNLAKAKNINLQEKASEAGLMPYQYEYDKSLKIYSITIDLEMIGKDENFEQEENYKEADNKEKADRVNAILNAIENLSLAVKGNLDNAEPVFAVGGLSDRKTHYFENVIKVEEEKLIISGDLKDKIEKGYYVGLLEGKTLQNEKEIKEQLNPISITKFLMRLDMK
ncbi:type I-B CRISPR-associated protein Cas7/Cst2/DevR [Clostridium botulinum]|nr:type I-B CRISPR-associated protein Cas7/Cst2/DevR [Clostridium botulinum]MCS4472573.1 type I-B CRISPR-associated protein Cas7/Cst2/DevR [Clostridium botulinum]MCS4476763.1 type I-B CRISPR-associated protein Cas7/Cst2/DevR [Clostridium botulinum]MCS4480937.1 type I-B CRISPR-associated protein Cas7/Cst2/DevR [Clostridium botulinum]MCS4482183.1 type I-B CRISPR-associated protein Cas7/Cst2/DevR [Clostridium botulinum]